MAIQKILAIKHQKHCGVHQIDYDADIAMILKKYTGKKHGVPYRIFDIPEREEAIEWATSAPRKKTPPPHEDFFSEVVDMSFDPSGVFRTDEKLVKENPEKYETKFEAAQRGSYKNVHRQYLGQCFVNNKYTMPLVKVYGEVFEITNEGVMLKNVVVEYKDEFGRTVRGVEDHIWVYDTAIIIDILHVKVGMCISFKGFVYHYTRSKNGSGDFSVDQCKEVQILKDYKIPSTEKLMKQEIHRNLCHMCTRQYGCNRMDCKYSASIKENIDRLLETYYDILNEDVISTAI